MPRVPFFQANANIDNRLMEAGESYLRTVPIWRMHDDVPDEGEVAAATAAAADTAVAVEHPRMARPPSYASSCCLAEEEFDTFSGEKEFEAEGQADEVNIFSGEEGHELFIRLLMEVDDESIVPGFDFTAAV